MNLSELINSSKKDLKPLFEGSIIHYSDLDLNSLKEFFDIKNNFSNEVSVSKNQKISFEEFLESNSTKLNSYIQAVKFLNKDSNEEEDQFNKIESEFPIRLEEEFSEIFLYDYTVFLYEFLNILIIMANKDMLFELNILFLNLGEEELIFFYHIPILFTKNILLMKNYFSFLFKYRSKVKSSVVN